MEFAFSSRAVNNALVADWRTDTHFVSQQSPVLRQTDVEITLLRPPTDLGPVRICVRVIGRLSEVDKPPKSVTHGQCDARPTVTFQAAGHHRPLTGRIKLHCLVTKAHACEQLAQGCCLKVERPGVEPATVCVASQHPSHQHQHATQASIRAPSNWALASK